MGQYILSGLGLLLTIVVIVADGACPELRPMKKLLCYLELKGTPPPLDTCLCTHLIVTTPLSKITPDSDVISNIKEMRARNPDLQVLGMATDPAENVIKRRGAYVRSVVSILRKTGLDGVELDFKWTNKYNGKETFVDLVKHLSKEMNRLDDNLRRSKRDEDDKKSEEIESEESETESTSTETLTTDSTTKAATTTNTEDDNVTENEQKENKSEETEDVPDETSEKHPIIVRLPIQPKALAKNFDLKRLSKYVNFFTISSENVTDASETGLTYHPSRLMGIEDILNTDSLVDLITGLGAPHPKMVISLPGFALRFTLSDQEKNLPLSPIKGTPQRISQGELCTLMAEGKWTIERDEDLTAPYAFKNDTWLAFDDPTSTAIKGKYILLRDLAGAAIMTLDYEDWLGKCNKSSLTILPTLYDTFTNTARKSRAAQLISLQEQLHQSSPFTFSADVQLSPYRIVRVVDRSGAIHVVRKEAKTEFECSRQGYFRHPSGCNRFYRCVKFNQYSPDYTVFEYDCPAGLAFDEKYEVCVWPGSLEDGGACQGSSEIAPVPRNRYSCPRVEGYFADPENCRWFFACLDHVRDGVSPLTAYEFRCPFGLVFNEQTLTCDWPWNVAGCGAAGSYRAHLTVGDILEGRTRASYATLPDYHVSGGRIENTAGGVVLGSLLPGVVDGNGHQGAYSNEFGSKYYGGSGLYHGAGLHAGGYDHSSGAYSGHGSEAGGYRAGLSGLYSGAGGKYSGSGAYSGIYGGQYAAGSIHPGINGVYTSDSGKYSGSGYSGADGKYEGGIAGIYSGGNGQYSGSSGTYSGSAYSGDDGKYKGSIEGIYSGGNGQYSGSSGTYSGSAYSGDDGKYKGSIEGIYSGGNGQYSGSSGTYSGSAYSGDDGKYKGSIEGIYSGGNGQYSGSSVYSSSAGKLGGSGAYNEGSGKYSGDSGAYRGSGYEYKGSEQFLSGGDYSGELAGGVKSTVHGTGYASGSGFGIHSGFGSAAGDLAYTTGIKSGAAVHTGLGGVHGSYEGAHLATGVKGIHHEGNFGTGEYYESGEHGEGFQTHSGAGGSVVYGKPGFSSFESTFAGKGHYGSESVTPGPASIHGGGHVGSVDYKDFGYKIGAEDFHVGHEQHGLHGQGFVSTPAPPVTQFYASTPVVTTYKTPFAVTPTPISVSTYKTPLSTPRPSTYYLPPVSQISIASPTPVTYQKPVVYESATIKPIQHFGAIPAVPVSPSPATVVHEAVPVIPVSPSPTPFPTLVKDYHSYSGSGYHKVSPPISVTPVPPLSPVSYLSGVSFHKTAVPISTISPPVGVPISTPAPPLSSVKLSYHPRPHPVPIESYHISAPVALPAVPVSTPAPPIVYSQTYSPKPVIPISVSTPAPSVKYYPKPQPVLPIHTEEYEEGYHYSKPVIPVSSTYSPPIVVPVSTPAPPVKYYPKPQPVLPIHTEEYEEGYHYSKPVIPVSSTYSPPIVVPVSTPAPPVKYYPKPQPVLPIHTEEYEEGYHYSKPVIPVSSTYSPPIVVPVSTPAPPVKYYPKPQPVVPIHTEDHEEGYHYSKPLVSISTLSTPAPPPVSFGYSTPASVSYHSGEGFEGYHYSKPAIGFSYPKPPAEVFKSIVSTPVPTVTPAPIIVSSTPSYTVKSEYIKPIEFKSSTVSVTPTPIHHSTLLPVQYKNVEVGFTYPKIPLVKSPPVQLKPIDYEYSYPQSFGHHVDTEHTYKEVSHQVPLVTPSPPPPAPVVPAYQSVEVPHTYPKPAIPVVPFSPASYKTNYELHYEKPVIPKLSPLPPSQFVHRYEEYGGYNYKKPIVPVEYKPVNTGYAYPQPAPPALPPVNYGYSYPKPAVFKAPVTPAPKDYYNIPTAGPPVSSVQFGSTYEKHLVSQSPQPTYYTTAVPPPSPPVIHYETVTSLPPVSYKPPSVSYGSAEFSKVTYEKPEIYLSSPKPFSFKEPDYSIKYTTPAPVKPINYGYSYPKPAVVPAIQVTSTPIPPLNPVTYTYKQPAINFYSTTAGYSEYSTPSPPVVSSYKPISTIAPLPVTPPPVKIDYVQPTVQYLPPVRNPTPSYVKPLPPVSYSTPSPFKPAGFAQLGPKYQLVDVYQQSGFSSSTPLPPPPQPIEISSYKFGYDYEKPAPIEVSSVTPSPLPSFEYKTTVKPAIYVPPVETGYAYSKPYIKSETYIPVTSTPIPPPPPPPEPMYKQVFNVIKTPVVSAYEKVLNVLKATTPETPVYVNHYTSTTPAPELLPVAPIKTVPVVPHRFEFASGYEKEHGDALYETLQKEFGTKLTSLEGYDYQKPVVPFVEEVPLPKLKIPSTTYRPVVAKTYTTQRPAYVDTYESVDYTAGKGGEVYYSSTPAPPKYVTQTYKPVVQQYLQEVYSKPVVNVGYGAEEGHVSGDYNVQFVPSTTPAPLPPITTARVSLPVIKAGGCVNCGYSKSQRIKVTPSPYPLPVTFSTPSSPFTTIGSTTAGFSYSSPTFSTTPVYSSTTPAYPVPSDLDEEHELEIANEEEEQGAKILEEYSKSGQFGGVISSSAGLKGIALSGGSLSSTTVSSLKDGEAIVGVVKKEKNIYTGRSDKAKVVVVSRLSDFNPILVGKLGAECSCKSNQVSLNNEGDLSNHRIESSGLFVPNGHDLVSNPPVYTSSSLSPIIVPDSGDYQKNGIYSSGYGEKISEGSSFVEIKPVPYKPPTTVFTTASPFTKVTEFYETSSTPSPLPTYSVSPTTSTVIYEEPTRAVHANKVVNTLVRHKPVYIEKSLRPTYQQVLVPTIPAQTIVDLESGIKVTAGKAFDRYGPGGWRGIDETLQGSVDCKRPGLFRHPKYCNKFYSCNWDQWKKRYTLHVFNCPVHLAYDSQLGACNWPSKGPACADDNLLV